MTAPGRPRGIVERILDVPQGVLLWLPWPSTPRIIITGSFGFLRQWSRSRRSRLDDADRR